MIKSVQLSAVIFASDLVKMTTFYLTLLGASDVHYDEFGNWVELNVGESRIWIHLIGSEWRTTADTSETIKAQEKNPIKLVLTVPVSQPEIDTRVIRLGGSLIERQWGNDYSDPEGNVFSIRVEATG